MGALTHFWSTACGGATPAFDGPLAGSTVYRFYFDGEATPSIEMQPRMAVGFGFFGSMAPPAPAPSPPVPPHGDAPTLHMMGRRGETCDAACASAGRTCIPHIDTQDAPDLMAALVKLDLGIDCTPNPTPWWAPDQPSYVWAANNSNYNECLGYKGIPDGGTVVCNGSHPLVQRLCQCSGPPPLAAVDSASAVAAVVPDVWAGPWGTEFLGKTSDMDGFFLNFAMPFYSSVRVTVQLPVSAFACERGGRVAKRGSWGLE
jgi:hypothetical protein